MSNWYRFYLRLRARLRRSHEIIDENMQEQRETAFLVVSQDYDLDIYPGAELALCYAFEVHRTETKGIQLDPLEVMTVYDVEPVWNFAVVSTGMSTESLPLHIVVDMRRQFLRNNGFSVD